MKKNRADNFKSEETTKIGEMIPSMFNWITPDIQAKVANHLAKATKNELSGEITTTSSSPKKN